MNVNKWMCVFAALGAIACTSGESDGGDLVLPPSPGGKADSLGMHDRGFLEYGERAQGAFEADLQFETYEFFGGEGALVDIEVTQRGSSRGLDTTLFLYGPRENGEWPASSLMQDDNDGWGDLSKLGNVEIRKEGFYLVVIGTADGRGRGNYALELSCASDDCLPSVPSGTCHGIVEDTIRNCIGYVYREGDLDDINLLVDQCMVEADRNVALEFFDWELGQDGSDPADAYWHYFCEEADTDFCRGETRATFTDNVMPACESKLRVQDTFDPPTFESIVLDELKLSDWAEQVYEECGDYCYLDPSAHRVTSGDRSIQAVTKTLATTEIDHFTPAAVYNPSTGASGVMAELGVSDLFGAFITDLGLEDAEYEEGVYSDAGQFFPSVDVTLDYYVRYYPEADIAFGLGFSTASE